MRTKVIFLTILLFLSLSLLNCIGTCDFDPVPEFFDIQDLEIVHRDIDNAIVVDSTIHYSKYGYLSCNFIVEYISSPIEDRSIFSPFNPVYGCDPPSPGSLGAKEESIVDFQLMTINEFDEDHPAGSSLNDLIIIEDFGVPPSLLSDYLNEDRGLIQRERFELHLSVPPSLDQEFQVSIRIELSTGEFYEVESEAIIFL